MTLSAEELALLAEFRTECAELEAAERAEPISPARFAYPVVDAEDEEADGGVAVLPWRTPAARLRALLDLVARLEAAMIHPEKQGWVARETYLRATAKITELEFKRAASDALREALHNSLRERMAVAVRGTGFLRSKEDDFKPIVADRPEENVLWPHLFEASARFELNAQAAFEVVAPNSPVRLNAARDVYRVVAEALAAEISKHFGCTLKPVGLSVDGGPL